MFHHPRHSETLFQRCDEVSDELCYRVTDVDDNFSDPNDPEQQDAYKQDEEQVQQFMLNTL